MSNLKPPPPPPRRSSPAVSPSSPAPAEKASWSAKLKAKGGAWGKVAIDKSVVISDAVGGRVNDVAEKRFGTEAFWPVTGDLPKEMDKCARILRTFTVDGVITEDRVTEKQETDDKGKGKDKDKDGKKKARKVLRKIPPSVIASAKGIVIFTAMRTGIAPFGGAGGSGVVLARLPDGSWSAPASISPNNLSAGFLLGVDVYDCILVLRSQEVVDGFRTHKFTLGAEIGVAAGPWGSGGSIESGLEKAPVFSYIKSKGLYAGIEIVGQVFVERFDENGAMYHWKGVKAGDILSGKVRVPPEAAKLHAALKDAETGKAQQEKGNGLNIVVDENSMPIESLQDGEVLKLPPTPDQTDGNEHLSDPETTRVHHESRPGSGSHTPNTSRAAPALPPRVGAGAGVGSGLGSPNARHGSSTSHYSDAAPGLGAPPSGPPPQFGTSTGFPSTFDSAHVEYAPPVGPPPDFSTHPTEVDTLGGGGGPPGYTEFSGPGPDFVPDQKRPIPDENEQSNHYGASFSSALPNPFSDASISHNRATGSTSQHVGGQAPHGEMSETERREWDEYYAQQGINAGVQDLHLGGGGGVQGGEHAAARKAGGYV